MRGTNIISNITFFKEQGEKYEIVTYEFVDMPSTVRPTRKAPYTGNGMYSPVLKEYVRAF